MTANGANGTPQDRARESRAAQGLPPQVKDRAVLERIAAILAHPLRRRTAE